MHPSTSITRQYHRYQPTILCFSLQEKKHRKIKVPLCITGNSEVTWNNKSSDQPKRYTNCTESRCHNYQSSLRCEYTPANHNQKQEGKKEKREDKEKTPSTCWYLTILGVAGGFLCLFCGRFCVFVCCCCFVLLVFLQHTIANWEGVTCKTNFFPSASDNDHISHPAPKRSAPALPKAESEGTSSHMMSTKNSQGLPMAFWKDCRLPVSSGGTELSSLTGGPPGGPLVP